MIDKHDRCPLCGCCLVETAPGVYVHVIQTGYTTGHEHKYQACVYWHDSFTPNLPNRLFVPGADSRLEEALEQA